MVISAECRYRDQRLFHFFFLTLTHTAIFSLGCTPDFTFLIQLEMPLKFLVVGWWVGLKPLSLFTQLNRIELS